MSEEKTYSISELARAADVTTRTVRYYVAEALLPPPSGGGRAASYGEEHLARLELIKILKDEYLPLQEIRTLLSGLDAQAVAELLEEKRKRDEPPAPEPNSAKAYLKTLLKPALNAPAETPTFMRHQVKAKKQVYKERQAPERAEGEATDQGRPLPPPSIRPKQHPDDPGTWEEEAGPRTAYGARRATESDTEMAESVILQRGRAEGVPHLTRWQRIELSPGVELHIVEGLKSKNLWQKVEQLIEVARQILK